MKERQDSRKWFKKQTYISFDVHDPHENDPGYREIYESLWAQKPPPEKAIQALSAHLGGHPDRALKQLRLDIFIWQQRIDCVLRRDEAIVQNLHHYPGHTAIVIGFHHVADLTERLIRDCKQSPDPFSISQESQEWSWPASNP